MSQVLVNECQGDFSDQLLKSAASKLKGSDRRMFRSEVCDKLCSGNARAAEKRFGWGRATIEKGSIERAAIDSNVPSPVTSGNRGKQRSEEANPQLAVDIRLVVEPNSYCDPELKTGRVYTMASREVYQALLKLGYTEDELPSERTLRDILNRMNFRLKRIQKAKPLKKTPHTDAIFENVKAVRQEAANDDQTLEISVDTKTKVKLGEFSLGGKNTDSL